MSARLRSFTVLELLIAIGLLSVLLTSIGGFTWNVVSRRQTLVEWMQRMRVGNALIDGLEASLMTCLAGGGEMGSGIEGTTTSLRVVGRSIWVQEGGIGPVDLVGTDVEFDPATGKLRLERWSGDERLSEELEVGIARLRFRYWDGGSWRDRFDSGSDGLPAAVEVALWFGAAPGASNEPVEFDERELAPEPLNEDIEWPAPDRLRVIVVPDGGSRTGASP